jgi:uncharacterized protein
MIIETILSTLDENGHPNFAPMGVVWEKDLVTVRPFRKTRTCRNMLSQRFGVANLTDNVLAFVQCGLYELVLGHFPAKAAAGVVFEEACCWRELAVISIAGDEDRAELGCRVIHEGRQKDFLGFCRARNAVIEAAILATRLSFYDRNAVPEKMTQYGEIVAKTGGETERRAFQLVCDYIRKRGRP